MVAGLTLTLAIALALALTLTLTASVPAWSQAALAQLPTLDGVPDEASRRALHHALATLPDACPPGGLDLSVAGALRDALVEFARACRRMASAADFDTEAYAWS